MGKRSYFMTKSSIITAALLGLLLGGSASAGDIPAGNFNVPAPSMSDQDFRALAFQQARPQAQKKGVPAQRQAQAQVQVPSGEGMLIMIRSSLLALSQANQTNNYAVLNALGSDNFRTTNSPQRLSDTFASFRANNIDLAPVALINPQLSAQPAMKDGRLRLVGFFPSQPMQVNFDLSYEPTQAGWKLFGIAVNLNRAQQAGQAPSAAPPASR
jgi:hypothetical protein